MRCNNPVMLLAISALITFCFFIVPAITANAGIDPVEGCIVTINKVATPADNTPFTFESNFNGNFILQDPFNNSTQYLLPTGEIEEVVEIVPDNWELVNVQCVAVGVDGDNIDFGVSFQCLTIGGTVDCTFFNEGPEPAPTQVPTLSGWGLAATAGLLLVSGVYVFYRRRKAAA